MCGVPEGTVPSAEEAASGQEFKLELHRIDIKLMLESGLLPEHFAIFGIKLLQGDSEKGCAHADIYEALHPDGRKVAVKKLRRSHEKRAQNSVSIYFANGEHAKIHIRQAFMWDSVSTWKNLNHPNVLTFLGFSVDVFPDYLCLVSIWADNDNIMRYINVWGFQADEVHRLVRIPSFHL